MPAALVSFASAGRAGWSGRARRVLDLPSLELHGRGAVTAVGAFVSFGIYLVGIILVVSGLVYAATILHLPTQWIVVATLLTLGDP